MEEKREKRTKMVSRTVKERRPRNIKTAKEEKRRGENIEFKN